MASVLLLLLVLLLFTRFPGNDCMRTLKRVQVKTGASVAIPCLYDQKYKNNVKYWCKGNQQESCNITVRTDSPQSKGEVSITDNPNLLLVNMTMRNLQKEDSGTYCCGVKISDSWNASACLNLTVTPASNRVLTESWFTAERGGSVTIPCHYDDQKYKNSTKRWCRGHALSSCTTMVQTDSPQSNGEVSITDDPTQLVFNVTMKNLREMDSDWYWCEVKTDNGSKSVPLYLLVTAAPGLSATQSCPSTLLIILPFVGLLLLLLVVFVMHTWILQKKPKDPETTDRDGGTRWTPTLIENHERDEAYSTVGCGPAAQREVNEPLMDPGGAVVYSTIVVRQKEDTSSVYLHIMGLLNVSISEEEKRVQLSPASSEAIYSKVISKNKKASANQSDDVSNGTTLQPVYPD